MPSPLLRSLTSRMTRNSRKKVIEMRALSSVFCGETEQSQKTGEEHTEHLAALHSMTRSELRPRSETYGLRKHCVLRAKVPV